MQIRRALPGEHRRLAEIHVIARYDMAYLPRVHSFSSTETWMREVVVPSNDVWVAEIDRAVVAYAWLHAGYLQGLYVHPSYQRQGIGGRLLSVVRESTAGGFHLWVFEANNGAIRFYERHGARLVRKTDGSGNEEKLPDRLMSFG